MKKVVKTLAIIFALLPMISFAQNAKAPVWAEMKAFHQVMSASFHPAEEHNYAPLKQNADSLFAVAKRWEASPLPANLKPKETKEALAKLVKQCDVIKMAVAKNVSDEKLMSLITEAHDTFHTIAGECKKEAE